MGKRLTYEFVKESFEKEGYELLSREYINSKTKLDYRCPKGHEHSIIWNSWQQGMRCPHLVGKARPTIEFIKLEFAKENYKLLTTEYKNNYTKLEYKCSRGHCGSIRWGNWTQGQRCPHCVSNNIKLTIEFIRFEFAKENYKLLTTEYKNAHQKLEYICSEGHMGSICWSSWQQGIRCPHRSKYGNRYTIEYIKSEFAKEGYELLTTKYINNRQKLDYICPKGHKGGIRWNDWKNGHRCPYCTGNNKPTIEFIRSEFAKENYISLSIEYKNNKQKLDYICDRGHKHSIKWNDWKNGHRCPECVGKISKGEIEVRNFIESLRVKVLSNDRSQIFNPETGNGLELDIFMPTLNKAIEYNGEYWHQDEDRDLFKQHLCKSKSIKLLTIWDKEWKTQKDACKSKIKKFVFNKEEVFK
jgi:hypothetical protein